MRWLQSVAMGPLAFLAQISPVAAADLTIDWSIVNNFRLIDGEKEQRDFFADIQAKLKCDGRNCGPSKTGRRCAYNNYCTKFKPEYLQYPNSWYTDKRRQVRLQARGFDQKPAPRSCVWSKMTDGQATKIATGTTPTLTLNLGRHLIKVDCTFANGAIRTAEPHEINLRDVKIVAVGDSYISGEGSPHVVKGDPNARVPAAGDNSSAQIKQAPAQWLEERCHSSLLSSTGIAAAELAQKNQTISVTYVNLACSGAEMTEGILPGGKNYPGRVTTDQLQKIYSVYNPGGAARSSGYFAATYIKPQIEQLRDMACKDGVCQPPDYLFLLTGGNELDFGQMVVDFTSGCNKACLQQKQPSIKAGLNELPGLYTKFKTKLSELFTPAPNVVLLQYPNPVQYAIPGRKVTYGYCEDTFWKGFISGVATVKYGLTTNTTQFAYKNVLVELNRTLGKIAKDNDWRIVGSIEQVSRRHGYCASKKNGNDGKWINEIADSAFKQDIVPTSGGDPRYGGLPTGAMHPNLLGHYNMAAEIQRCFEVDELLKTKQDPREPPTCPRLPIPDVAGASATP